MRRAVEAHLGYDPFDDAAGLQVHCRIVTQHSQWVAMVNVADQASRRSGERKIVSRNPSCSELADAAALAIAIAIDPLLPKASLAETTTQDDSERREPAADESLGAPRAAGLAPHADQEVHASTLDAEQQRIPLIVSLGAGGSLSYALQPTAAVGLGMTLAVQRGAMSLALEAQWRAPSHVTYLNGTISAQLFNAALVGCGHSGAMNICMLADAGMVMGSANGYLRSAHDVTPFVAPGLRVGWHPFLFENGSVLIHVTGLVPVVRTTLWVDPQSVWSMPRFAAEAGILGFFKFL